MICANKTGRTTSSRPVRTPIGSVAQSVEVEAISNIMSVISSCDGSAACKHLAYDGGRALCLNKACKADWPSSRRQTTTCGVQAKLQCRCAGVCVGVAALDLPLRTCGSLSGARDMSSTMASPTTTTARPTRSLLIDPTGSPTASSQPPPSTQSPMGAPTYRPTYFPIRSFVAGLVDGGGRTLMVRDSFEVSSVPGDHFVSLPFLQNELTLKRRTCASPLHGGDIAAPTLIRPTSSACHGS